MVQPCSDAATLVMPSTKYTAPPSLSSQELPAVTRCRECQRDTHQDRTYWPAGPRSAGGSWTRFGTRAAITPQGNLSGSADVRFGIIPSGDSRFRSGAHSSFPRGKSPIARTLKRTCLVSRCRVAIKTRSLRPMPWSTSPDHSEQFGPSSCNDVVTFLSLAFHEPTITAANSG